MTRKHLLIPFLVAFSASAPAQNLFNGKDLAGWEGNPELWRVENGVIVGETTPEKKADGNTFLIWKGGAVADFMLTLKARVIGGNNSGVQYRSKVVDPKNWVVAGYQLDMHPSPDYLGMLYEEKGRGILAQRGQRVTVDDRGKPHAVGSVDKSATVDLAEWNEYSIIARGNRIIHRVNGAVTVELIDNDNVKRAMSGVLALQLHAGAPMRVEAKDIRLVSAPSNAARAKAGEKLDGPTPYWIWTKKEAGDGTIWARREWTQSVALKSAKLDITCDNGFTAFVNGKQVGSGSEWATRYQFDVTKHLRSGVNVLAVEATNEGAIGGLVARVSLEAVNGKKAFVTTGPKWLVSEQKREGWAAPGFDTAGWKAAVVIGAMGVQPWGNVFANAPGAAAGGGGSNAPAVHPEGFELTKIYTVPKNEQGSWVSMAVDDKGRLYCSDQGGKGIFRVTLGGAEPKVEKIPADITGAHGLEWAFGALYVCANERNPGLYRVTDSDGDDALDKVELLRKLNGGGEHGPHAVVLAPDGESLFVLGGNHTKTPDPETSAVLLNYGEDQLLPRMTDARGHAAGIRAPGGWIARTDKDGKSFELYSAGYRNQYDVAFNADGEMFTFDSDMEWDSGTPWYRPTRFYHVTRGSEFGWRTGTGKFPTWYPDTLPPALDIGPGSPTGVMSGLGAKFPAKYQDAIYIFDWTYGTIYAMHLTPEGASYSATKEEFVTGVPLNVTDGVIGKDGDMYFAVGGRGTNSALFKVKYTGPDPTNWQPRGNKLASSLRGLRQQMEKYHGEPVAGAVEKIWPNLGHKDRHVRYAARVALEHQPVGEWQDKALAESDIQTSLSALLALSRQGDASLQPKLLDALSRLPTTEMPEEQKLEALRVLGLCFIRMGKPDAETAAEVAAALNPFYPAPSDALNRELVALLVYLGASDVIAKTVPLMEQDAAGPEEIEFDDNLLKRSGGYGSSFLNQKATNPQRQQIWYAYALKNVAEGWTPALREAYFNWFAKSRNFKGGASFGGFIENFRKESLAKIPDENTRKEMDALSKQAAPLVPEGYAEAREIKVGVLPGMKFDVEQLEAEAGEKVAIVLLNNDPTGLMHNLAVCAPGSREKVVAAALAIGPKAIEQNFVPDIPEVLASTPQVAPGRKYTLYMTAPNEPGDYPYVCTYPGHGQVMFGVLKVAN